jgi:hypothetical protein
VAARTAFHSLVGTSRPWLAEFRRCRLPPAAAAAPPPLPRRLFVADERAATVSGA